MNKNLYFLLNPNDEEKRFIEKLLNYLVRTQFKELCLPDVRKDAELSEEEKGVLEIWFHPDYDLIRLGNITFRRYGIRWNYEIHSIESPLLMAGEVLFWLKEEYTPGSSINITDRTFISRVLEVYQEILDDRLSEEVGLTKEELQELRIIPKEDFFEYILNRLRSGGFPHLLVNSDNIALLVAYFKDYELTAS